MYRRTAAVISAVLIAGAALAHEGATGVVAERMTVMKNIGREMKAIGDMLRGKAPFDAAAVRQHADVLHENCHGIENLFPQGSSIGHHSRALPAIWEKPEMFKQEMQQLHSATEALVATAALGDRVNLAATFEQVQKTCTGCHETFRLPGN